MFVKNKDFSTTKKGEENFKEVLDMALVMDLVAVVAVVKVTVQTFMWKNMDVGLIQYGSVKGVVITSTENCATQNNENLVHCIQKKIMCMSANGKGAKMCQ